MKSGRSKAALHGTFWSGLNAIVPVVLNSAVFIISSRYLGPADFGIVALAISLVTLVSAFVPASYGEALVQLGQLRRSHLDSVFWLCLATASLLYGVLVMASSEAAHLSGHSYIRPLLALIGVKLLFDAVAVVPTALIARSLAFHLLAFKTTVASFFACVICVILLARGYGIWALAFSQVAVGAANAVSALIGARWRPTPQLKWEAVRELSPYGLFASADRFLQRMNLDQILIGTLIGTTQLGIFNFARRLFQMLSDVIAGALGSVSYALFSSLQGEQPKLRDAFLTATFGSAILCFPAFMGLGAIAAMAIPFFFGAQWAPAVIPTRWFCAIGLISCIGVIQSSFINSQGRTDWWFSYQLLRQVIAVITVVALRNVSLSMLVMAMAIQYYLFWPISTLMVAKLLDVKLGTYLRQFREPLAASLVMLAFIVLVETLTTPLPVPIRLIIDIVAGATVYATLVSLVCRKRLAIVAKVLIKRAR